MLLVERFQNNVSHKGRRCARPVRRANAGDAMPIGELAQRCRPRCSGDRLQLYFGNVLLAPDQVSPTARTRTRPPSRRCWTLSSSRASFRNWSAWRRPDHPLITRSRKGLAEQPPHHGRKRKPARCRLESRKPVGVSFISSGWSDGGDHGHLPESSTIRPRASGSNRKCPPLISRQSAKAMRGREISSAKKYSSGYLLPKTDIIRRKSTD